MTSGTSVGAELRSTSPERKPTGLKGNVNRTARAIGISTACSQYEAATTSAMIPQFSFTSVLLSQPARRRSRPQLDD
jgi:hypothetical protein